MNPGLLPVLWIEVPPSAQAASIRSRVAGSRLGRVVELAAGRHDVACPDSSRRQTSSKSQPCGM